MANRARRKDAPNRGPGLPPEALEFCRLLARILRRRIVDIEAAEESQKKPASMPGVAHLESINDEDKLNID